jgi:two-component SAPR family response regulator
MQTLTIRTFGETDVRINETSVKWRSDSARVLFFYLLSHPNGRSREQIIDTLWHTDPDFAASGRFRVVVYRLRAALQSQDAVLEDHSQYRLDPAILKVCDSYLFTVAVEQARLTPSGDTKRWLYELALGWYGGEYLPDEPEDWALTARAQYRTTAARAWLELAMLHRERGACEASLSALEAALGLDPLIGEDHHQQLMLCLSTVRGKYAAVEHYRRYVNFLRSDLNDTPMLETTALAGRIKNGVSPCVCPLAQRPDDNLAQRPDDNPVSAFSELSCHNASRLEGAQVH